MTVGTLTLVILGAILLQLLIWGAVGLSRRRRAFRELGDRQKDTSASNASSMEIPAKKSADSRQWSGYREFRVVRREQENSVGDICSFYLAPVDAGPLPAFKPGQFLTFKLPAEADSGETAKPLIRCYSLSDRPGSDHYRVSVKRVPAPSGHPELPAGRSSNYFHDQVQEGDKLLVKAPSGHFHLSGDLSRPVVLIAGGIGITPMLSMLTHLLESGFRNEIRLFYGLRNGKELVMGQQLRSLAETHPNFHLHLCYSAPGDQEREGQDYQHRGHVDLTLLRSTLNLLPYQFYVCGPKAMMESLVPGLEAWGVAKQDIHYESFGPASLEKPARQERQAEAREPITVTFSNSGKSLPWDPSADSLLEFAEDNEIDVPSGCRAGSCGSCQTVVSSGEVSYNQEADAETEPGHCLLCITRPQSDLILEV